MKKHTTLKQLFAVIAGLLALAGIVNGQTNKADSLYLPGKLSDIYGKPLYNCELTIIYGDTGSEYNVNDNYEFKGVGNVSREISTELKVDNWGYFFITIPKSLFNKQVTLAFYVDGYKPYATTFVLSHFTPYLSIRMINDNDVVDFSVRGEPTEYIIDGTKVQADTTTKKAKDEFPFPVMDNHLPYTPAQFEGDVSVILPPPSYLLIRRENE